MKFVEYVLRNRWLYLMLFLSAGVLIWFIFVVPELLKYSSRFEYSSNVVSFDNFYDSSSGQYLGKQRSKTEFSFGTVSEEDSVLQIQNVFDVRTLEGDPIFTVSRQYFIDQYSGQHVGGEGDVTRSGYLFAPRMKGARPQAQDKSSFEYWHVNYNVGAQMEFVREEELFGLPVYLYRSNFSADQTEELGNLPEVGETRGITLDVELLLWIDPYTGYLVNYQDRTLASYYDLETNEVIEPWNSFENTFSTESVKAQVDRTIIRKSLFQFYSLVLPIFLLGGILFIGVIRFVVFLTDKKLISYRVANLVFPFIVSGLCILITLYLSHFVSQFIAREQVADFESRAERLNDSIIDRLEIYTNALYSARGLFEASQEVSRDEWFEFINGLAIQQNYPGIQGIGYSEVIEPEELISHIERIRNEGFPDYNVYPEGQRDVYTSIVYLEPFDERNQVAFGYDMFQNPVRREAMIRARDTNTYAMSGKVTLVQEIDASSVQSGFLIYLPVYEKGVPVNTIEQRREALLGYVYSPFRMEDFIFGTVQANDDIDFEIFDTDDEQTLTPQTKVFGATQSVEGRFLVTKEVDYGGRTWIIRYSTGDGFGQTVISNTVGLVILSGGFVLSSLLFLTMYVLNTREKTAQDLARNITSDLNVEKQRLSYIIEGTQLGTWELNISENSLICNMSLLSMIGEEDMKGRRKGIEFIDDRIHPDDRAQRKVLLKRHFSGLDDLYFQEVRMKHSNGEWIWVQIRGKVLVFDENGEPRLMYGVHQDISDRKKAEKKLQERAEELERINKAMVDRELVIKRLKEESK